MVWKAASGPAIRSVVLIRRGAAVPLYRINGQNVLFLHIPKTGGSSIERWLSRYSPPSMMRAYRDGLLPAPAQHLHAAPLSDLFDPTFIDAAFCVVRHPVERLRSEFVWRMQAKKIRRFAGLYRKPFDSATPAQRSAAFTVWLDAALKASSRNPWHLSNHLRPQVSFTDWPGTEVYRFEDGIDRALIQIADRLGLPAPEVVPHEKASGSSALDISDADRARIAQAYAKDFSTFGYDPAD
jgi:hypothetical protein